MGSEIRKVAGTGRISLYFTIEWDKQEGTTMERGGSGSKSYGKQAGGSDPPVSPILTQTLWTIIHE